MTDRRATLDPAKVTWADEHIGTTGWVQLEGTHTTWEPHPTDLLLCVFTIDSGDPVLGSMRYVAAFPLSDEEVAEQVRQQADARAAELQAEADQREAEISEAIEQRLRALGAS